MNEAIVLYIEDEESDVFFMRYAFKRAGLQDCLRSVPDGQQAIDYLSGTAGFADRTQHPLPSVILLDLNLPLVSGFEVLGWIRSRPEFRDLPVVVFSSSARSEDQSRAGEMGATLYLQKPGSGLEFGSVVQELERRWLGGGVPVRDDR